MAEINRGPFDLLEADSEIVAGFHIEYSGMKFAMFYLAEYGHALAMSAIAATLFFGGWKGFGDEWVGFLWFLVKVMFIFFLLIWARVTFPRLRVDHLMGFGWKFLFPLALVNLFIVAGEVIAWGEIPWWAIFINLPATVILIYVWSRLFKFGGGRVEVNA
jgi:NADH-quinone oxidoreductase subunit H